MKLKNQVIVQRLGDACVVYDNNHSILHEFNQVGFRIIELIEKKFSKDKIVFEITKEFEVSKSQAKEDVEEFLGVLVKKDLIIL